MRRGGPVKRGFLAPCCVRPVGHVRGRMRQRRTRTQLVHEVGQLSTRAQAHPPPQAPPVSLGYVAACSPPAPALVPPTAQSRGLQHELASAQARAGLS